LTKGSPIQHHPLCPFFVFEQRLLFVKGSCSIQLSYETNMSKKN
jgi:hypothetical protein